MNKFDPSHAIGLLRKIAQRKRDLWELEAALEEMVGLELDDLDIFMNDLANCDDDQIDEQLLKDIINSNLDKARQERIRIAYSIAHSVFIYPDFTDMEPATNYLN